MADKRVRYIIEFDTKSGEGQIKNLNGDLIKATNSARQFKQEVSRLTGADGKGGMQGLTTATGGASAAALELGRVVSDAPYGIRGMANNVSQLASNILFMSQQTDKATGKTIGFVGSLKGIFTALKGPLGVLLAVQAVIAAFDYFAGSTGKAKDEVDELSSSLDDLITKFDLVADTALIDEGGLAELLGSERASSGLKILLNEFTEFEKKYKSLTEEERSQGEIVNNLIKDYGELLNIRKSIEITAKELNELQDDDPEEVGRIEALKTRLFFLYEQKATLEEIFEVESAANKKTIKEFKQGLLDLSSELESFRNTEIQNADISEEERLKLEYDASRKSIENKVKEFEDKEKLRLEDKIKQINESKATEDEKAILIADANAKYNASIAQANADKNAVMLQADIAYYSELGVLRRKDTEDAKQQTDDLIAALRESNYEYQEFNAQQKINAATNELDRIKAEEEANKNLTALKITNLQNEALQKNKSAADIQEINNEISRLEHDQTLQQQELDKKSAQAKLAIANQVANAIISIAGEGSGIAKGVAVASTIWNTKEAVMAALGSKPYGPWNIAQAAAVAAMGIKNVKGILATKAPHEKSSGVNTSAASSGPTFSPDFNIVGASGQNQLAATVAGQVGEPTRAYVVYDDLRTAGEIEANAVEAAGI